jgi:hypothetical protein
MFPMYRYKKNCGFQLRTFTKGEHVAIRVIYRITGRAVKGLSGKEKRNAKLRNLRQYTEYLMTQGFALSEDFPSNGKASYFIRPPHLLKSRLESFEGIAMNSLLVADGQDINDMRNLYIVSSFWHGKEWPEFRLKSVRYGVQLLDNYNVQEAAEFGYKMVGTLSDHMVDELEKFWKDSGRVFFDVHQKLNSKLTYIQWKAKHKYRGRF